MAALHTLPSELALQIYAHLDAASRTVFPLVHRRLYSTFPIPPLDSFSCNSTKRDILQFLEEQCGIFHSRYAICYGTDCVTTLQCKAARRQCTKCDRYHPYIARSATAMRSPDSLKDKDKPPKQSPPCKYNQDTTCTCTCPWTTSPDPPRPSIHTRTHYFSAAELLHHRARGPRTRSCLFTSPSLIISPTRIVAMSHADVPFEPSRRQNPPESEQDAGSFVQINIDTFALRTRYALLTVPAIAILSAHDIACVLSGFAIPACPHTRVNDPRVMSVYDPCAPALSGPVLFDVADSEDRVRCRFENCKTELYWSVRLVEGDSLGKKKKVVYLHVSRILGTLQKCTDPAFLVQCAVPNMKRLTAVWERSMRWKEKVGGLIAERYEKKTGLKDDPLPMAELYHAEVAGEPLLWPVYGPPLLQESTFESASKS